MPLVLFVISLVLAFTMGRKGENDASSFLNNVRAADTSNLVNALIGGALFNLANLLLVAGIDMAGLAVAFPVSIGIALVVGVVLSYALQPRGNAGFLAGYGCRMRLRGSRSGWQGVWQPRGSGAADFEKKSLITVRRRAF